MLEPSRIRSLKNIDACRLLDVNRCDIDRNGEVLWGEIRLISAPRWVLPQDTPISCFVKMSSYSAWQRGLMSKL